MSKTNKVGSKLIEKEMSADVAQNIIKKAEESRIQRFMQAYEELCKKEKCMITGRMIITEQGNKLELIIVAGK